MGVTGNRLRITRAKLAPYSLPLKQSWKSHVGNLTIRRGYLLQIEDELGHIGYGDCAPLPSHGTETAAEALKILEPQTYNLPNLLASDALEKLPDMVSTPAARCAIETALLDLTTKQQATPMYRWLNPYPGPEVRVNASLGPLDRGLTNRIATAIAQGYWVFKLKVGVSEVKHELELLQQLCRNLPDRAKLRLDANCAWDFATATQFLHGIEQMPIESLEEPLTQPDINRLKQLQSETNIPLALDESIVKLDSEGVSQLHPLQRIILKPMALGGVIPAWHLGQQAHSLGIDTVVTSTIDSAAGVWAATQLAAALDPIGRLCHGLATSDWLQQDLGKGPNIENGSITMLQTPGLGLVPYS